MGSDAVLNPRHPCRNNWIPAFRFLASHKLFDRFARLVAPSSAVAPPRGGAYRPRRGMSGRFDRRRGMMRVRCCFASAHCAAIVLLLLGGGATLADECKNRGQLDTLYCDENNDLVADAPADTQKWKDPSTIVFAYTPVEDPAVYQNIFKPFTDFLGQCTGRRVVYYPVQSNSAEIEAMRSGRLHVAGFSTGA